MVAKTGVDAKPVPGMKIAAIAVLAIVFGLLALAAVAVAPWLFVPLLVGAITALVVVKGPERPWLEKAVNASKAVLGILAVVLVAWLVLNTRGPTAPRSAASALNTRVSALSGPAAAASASTRLTSLDFARLELTAAFQDERQKLRLVDQALALDRVADARFVDLNNQGHPDRKLGDDASALETAFATERIVASGQTFKPLDPAQLKLYVEAARKAIDRTEAEALVPDASQQALLSAVQGIPSKLGDFHLDTLYRAVTTLQQSLKDSLQLRIAPDVHYTAGYDREADALVTRQEIRLRLANTPAASIDVSNLFTSDKGRLGRDLEETVTLQEDRATAVTVDPKAPVRQLLGDVQELIVVRSVTRHHASEPLLSGVFGQQLGQVRVDWPSIRPASLILALQQHRDSRGNTWPFVVPVETPDTAALSRVTMPRNAVIWVDPATPVAQSASGDELTPTAIAGNLRRLSSSEVIRVELLPSWLSNSAGQKFKEYLEIENLWAAVAVWALTVGLFALFKWK